MLVPQSEEFRSSECQGWRALGATLSPPGSRGNARGPCWGPEPRRRPGALPAQSGANTHMPLSTVGVWMRVGKSRLGKKLRFKIKTPPNWTERKKKKSGGLEETPGPGAHWGPPALRPQSGCIAAHASSSGDRLDFRGSWVSARRPQSWEGDLGQGVWTARLAVGQPARRPSPDPQRCGDRAARDGRAPTPVHRAGARLSNLANFWRPLCAQSARWATQFPSVATVWIGAGSRGRGPWSEEAEGEDSRLRTCLLFLFSGLTWANWVVHIKFVVK